MGLLSGILNAGKTALNAISAAVTNPVGFVSNPAKATAQLAATREEIATGGGFSVAAKKVIVPTIVNTATAAAITLGASAVASKGIVATATSLIPATTKGKVIAAVAAPIVVGAVASNPVGTAKAVASTPSALANVGSNVGNLIANPSVANAKALVAENPVIVGGAVATAAVAGAAAIIPTIVNYENTKAVKENTAATIGSGSEVSVIDKSQGYFDKPASNNAPTPTLPSTSTISSGTTAKRKKRKANAKPSQIISQRVNIAIANRNNSGNHTTKRYLNVIPVRN